MESRRAPRNADARTAWSVRVTRYDPDMVKDFPLDYGSLRFDADDFVVLRDEAPAHLRTAAATLIDLDRDDRARQNWFSRWRRGILSRSLYRIADRLQGD